MQNISSFWIYYCLFNFDQSRANPVLVLPEKDLRLSQNRIPPYTAACNVSCNTCRRSKRYVALYSNILSHTAAWLAVRRPIQEHGSQNVSCNTCRRLQLNSPSTSRFMHTKTYIDQSRPTHSFISTTTKQFQLIVTNTFDPDI